MWSVFSLFQQTHKSEAATLDTRGRSLQVLWGWRVKGGGVWWLGDPLTLHKPTNWQGRVMSLLSFTHWPATDRGSASSGIHHNIRQLVLCQATPAPVPSEWVMLINMAFYCERFTKQNDKPSNDLSDIAWRTHLQINNNKISWNQF